MNNEIPGAPQGPGGCDSDNVRNCVNELLLRMIQEDFDEISIQATHGGVKVLAEYRELDGFNPDHLIGVVARFKIMAGCNPEIVHMIQKGEMRLTLRENPIHLQVETIPAQLGEGVLITRVR